MSKLRKIERDRTAAELATVNVMLSRLTDDDALMQLTLEDRRSELEDAISALGEVVDDTASVALFFGGRPVIGGKGIETEFAGQAVQLFQDVVSKQYAQDIGRLSDRGAVPVETASRMHITDVVRGSFGFLLEEFDDQTSLVQSPLKESVEKTSSLFFAFGEDDDRFDAAAEVIGQRVLEAAKSFFALLRQEGATFRLVSGETDRSFDARSVARALERAETTSIRESDVEIPGVLAGILPDGHMFEYRTETDRGIVRGKVARQMVSATLSDWNRAWSDKPSLGVFSSKQLLKSGRLVRENLTLNDIRHRSQ